MKPNPGDIIGAINELRSDLGKDVFLTQKGLMDVCDLLQKNPLLTALPNINLLITDLRTTTLPHLQLQQTKSYINSAQSNLVLSLFNARYFPSLNLDCFYYQKLRVPKTLSDSYHSPVLPVEITYASDGFYSDRVVALFPENHIDGIQADSDAIFYFIDKFVSRYLRITKPLLDVAVSPNCLVRLRTANTHHIERAAIYWVWLHEYHHRQGYLPIPQFLNVKSTKPLAGLEEMRVDMLSLLTLLNDGRLVSEDTALAFEFILAERLLRYPIEGDLHPTYDAIGSQILFNYLLHHNGLELQNNKINFTNDLVLALEKFIHDVTIIEKQAQDRTPSEAQSLLIDFVKQFAPFDPLKQQYSHNQFYEDLKSRFQHAISA